MLQHLLVGVVMNTQPLQDYISRLSGRSVAFDEVVSLSSAQQAAVRSWLRKNRDYGLPAAVKSRVSVKMLANGQEFAGAAPAAPSMETPLSDPPVERGAAVAGVGVDIEYASGLPEAEDYRTHSLNLIQSAAALRINSLRGPIGNSGHEKAPPRARY